jgi:hypothetical protein
VIPIEPNKLLNVKINRTVTNVGSPTSTYRATVFAIPKIKISVEPKLLSFKSLDEKQSFIVTVVGGEELNENMFSLSLIWPDGSHNAKSPIIVQILPQYN